MYLLLYFKLKFKHVRDLKNKKKHFVRFKKKSQFSDSDNFKLISSN